jgi:hypothetical protein
MTLRTPLLLAVLSFAASCDRGPMKSEAATQPSTTKVAAADNGLTLGAGVKLEKSVSVDELLADPLKHNGKTVRVEGMITDVCPKRGCWMNLAGSQPGQKLKYKVVDGEMVFPAESKGQWAIAEGVVAARQLTIEETKEQAEYEAKEYGIPYDEASITKPKVSVRIDGTGAVIRDKK